MFDNIYKGQIHFLGGGDYYGLIYETIKLIVEDVNLKAFLSYLYLSLVIKVLLQLYDI